MRNGLKEDKVPGAVAWTWTGEGELERMALLLISMSKVSRASFSLLHCQEFFWILYYKDMQYSFLSKLRLHQAMELYEKKGFNQTHRVQELSMMFIFNTCK